MRVLLAAINAKYAHMGLAVRRLKAYCAEYDVTVREYTINNSEESVLADIFSFAPDALGISCYIWNIDMARRLAGNLKKILPRLVIVAGGPEVSFCPDEVLNGYFDIVALGDGERAFKRLLETGFKNVEGISGIAFRGENGETVINPASAPVDINELPFPYDENDSFENKTAYYESSRGCPFHCSYCMSGTERLVLKDAKKCFSEIQFFIDKGAKRVKFTDRTFNCSKTRAMDIWRYIIENDAGTTNFHFEIAADLLDDEQIKLLSRARKGLFQFEVGVQSANVATLAAVNRKTDLERIAKNVRAIKNARVNLDLIVGLPLESYESFKRSFDFAYALCPNGLHIGFLKALKGSALRAEAARYGIIYRDSAPYETLCTNDISYGEILKLKGIEQMVEVYYNSERCVQSFARAVLAFPSPFSFYEAFFAFGENKKSRGKLGEYWLAHEFFNEYMSRDILFLEDLLLFDTLSFEKTPTMPEWAAQPTSLEAESVKKALARLGLKGRFARVAKFRHDIAEWIRNRRKVERIVFLAFDYNGAKKGPRYDFHELREAGD
ncbi:MAG: B12-binding domain-containing radical SAM protein [Clostridiales bacterium]|jgi:radical SAM superfamily enzyme YgiQ (UPF0313 family)|nr:B12-binding domain-containing radical SAM protein [Clostridiales bacterium]